MDKTPADSVAKPYRPAEDRHRNPLQPIRIFISSKCDNDALIPNSDESSNRRLMRHHSSQHIRGSVEARPLLRPKKRIVGS